MKVEDGRARFALLGVHLVEDAEAHLLHDLDVEGVDRVPLSGALDVSLERFIRKID